MHAISYAEVAQVHRRHPRRFGAAGRSDEASASEINEQSEVFGRRPDVDIKEFRDRMPKQSVKHLICPCQPAATNTNIQSTRNNIITTSTTPVLSRIEAAGSYSGIFCLSPAFSESKAIIRPSIMPPKHSAIPKSSKAVARAREEADAVAREEADAAAKRVAAAEAAEPAKHHKATHDHTKATHDSHVHAHTEAQRGPVTPQRR